MNLIANACDAMARRPARRLSLSVSEARRDGREYWRGATFSVFLPRSAAEARDLPAVG